MMKNTEWGAVAYLAHSKYGRNGTEVRINNNTGYYTGWGATTHNAAKVSYNASSVGNLWTGQYGLLASSTGNIYGIYDLSGGAYEYTAAYISGGDTSPGTDIVSATSKYKNVYTTYAKTANKYGDAIYETSAGGTSGSSKSWFGGYSGMPESLSPFFVLGGGCDSGASAGLFSFRSNNNFGGAHSNMGFRIVVVRFVNNMPI